MDHIDNDPSNNCLFNLRFVTKNENDFNSSIRSDNKSGVKCWNLKIHCADSLQYIQHAQHTFIGPLSIVCRPR